MVKAEYHMADPKPEEGTLAKKYFTNQSMLSKHTREQLQSHGQYKKNKLSERSPMKMDLDEINQFPTN